MSLGNAIASLRNELESLAGRVSPKTLNHRFKGTRIGRSIQRLSLRGQEPVNQLMAFLSEQEEFACFDGAMMTTSIGSIHVDYEALAVWLLWETRERSVDRACGALSDFLKRDDIPCKMILMVSGVELLSSGSIGQNLELVHVASLPEPSMLDSIAPAKERAEELLDLGFDLELAMQVLEITPTAAIVGRCTVSPQFRDQQAQQPPKRKSDFKELESLALDAARLMVLLVEGDVAPIPSHTLGPWEEWVPCSGVTGDWGQRHPRAAMNHMTKLAVSESHRADWRSLLDQFVGLGKQDKRAVTTALDRLATSVHEDQLEDSAIDLGIALEALLLSSHSGGGEFKLAFSLRGSWWLGTTPGERIELFALLQWLYKQRSQAAHGDRLDSQFRNHEGQDVPSHQALTIGRDLCRRVIRRTLELGGFPDWSSVVLDLEGDS
jgi:hypothetical protein